MTSFLVELGSRQVLVTVRSEDQRLLASVDGGPEQTVELVQTTGYRAALRLGNTSFPLLLRRTDAGAEVVLAGRLYTLRVEDARRAALRQQVERVGSTAAHPGDLRAPMAGLVLRVLCAEGSSVLAGQPLVVLQAMKMENELALPRDGTVRAIAVQPGQTVEQNQLLVEIG